MILTERLLCVFGLIYNCSNIWSVCWGGHILLFQTELRCSITDPGPLLPHFQPLGVKSFPFSHSIQTMPIVPIVMRTPGMGGGLPLPTGQLHDSHSFSPLGLCHCAVLCTAIFSHCQRASVIDSQEFISYHSAFKLFLFVITLLLEAGLHSCTR